MGGSYYILWGTMSFGLYKISVGLEDKISNSPDSSGRKKWIMVAIVTGCFAIGIGIFITIITL
jgi:hypothetical protein